MGTARSHRTAFSDSTGTPVRPRRSAARPGPGERRAVSGDGRGHDRVEGLLRPGGIVPVGLGQITEASVAAHDGDGRVGQAGEISGQVTHVGPASVFVVGEVAHVVQAVLDMPVVAHQFEQLLGSGALCAERGEAPGHLDAALAGLEDLAFALDAHGLASPVEVGVAVPLGSGEVDDGAASALDAAMALVDGFVPERIAEVDRLEVFEDHLLVVLDRAHHVVGATPEQAARGLVLSVHRVHGDDPACEVEAAGEFAHGRDFVALAVDLDLPEDHAGVVLDRRHHHPAPVFGLLRGAAQILSVHGDRRVRAAMLAGPLANRVVQGLWRQGGEGLVEGGDRGRGVALFGRAPERTHRLELLLGEQGGELGERVHPPVSGKPGGDGDHQNGVERIALAPGMAVLGHLTQTLEQAAQPGRGHRLGVLLGVPVCRHPGTAQRLGGAVCQSEHEDLLGLTVVAPARCPSGLTGKAPRQPQRAPVRRAVAGAGKSRDVHERLRQKSRISVHRLDVLRQPPQAQPQHTGGQVRHSARRQNDEARVVGDQMQTPELLLGRPPDPAITRAQLERAGLPADQCEPGLAMHRDMAQALADDAVERQVVVLLHQPVPAPVLLRAPGRTHRDRAQINGRIRDRQRRHDRHTATPRMKWPAPRSPHPDHWADKKLHAKIGSDRRRGRVDF